MVAFFLSEKNAKVYNSLVVLAKLMISFITDFTNLKFVKLPPWLAITADPLNLPI
jgi:hypothetical protein